MVSDQRRLDAKLAGGLAWSVGAKWVTQLVTWASVLVSARLLSPTDFGLVDMAGIAVNIANMVAEFGLGSAVMQMPELTRRQLRQVNSASVALCSIAFAAIVVSSPLIASFFHAPQLRPVVIVTSLAFFITGFQAVPQGLLQRDLDYRRLCIAEAAGALVQAVVTASCALGGMGYWSLVAGVTVGKATNGLMTSWWRPVGFAIPRWRDIAKPLRFGGHLAASRLAFAAYSQADGVIVGRVLGGAALGTYRIAINLASAPAEKISMLIMRVTGPLFAKVQEDRSAVRRYFLMFTEVLAVLLLPLMLGLAVVSSDAVRVIFGPKWIAVNGPLRWLALFLVVRTLSSLISQVIASQRHTAFTMWMSLVNFAVMPAGFYFAARWGCTGVAAAWILLCPVTIGPAVVKLFHLVQIRYEDYVQALWPALVASLGMLVSVITVRSVPGLAALPPAASLTLQVVPGGLVYCAILLLISRSRVLRYFRYFRQVFANRWAFA
jgi:O-antigen/teichoic acid export membrane protein